MLCETFDRLRTLLISHNISARPGGSKDSSSKDTSETNPHPTSNGAPPSMSEAGHDDVHQQSVQEAMALIARLRKKLNELEEENRDVLQTARDARVIAARLKEKLAFERAKTDKVVNFLTTWQKTHAGFKFDEHFPSEGRSESEYAIDQELGNETLSRLKRDFEGVLTKRQFSQLKRRLAQVERKKKSRNAKYVHSSYLQICRQCQSSYAPEILMKVMLSLMLLTTKLMTKERGKSKTHYVYQWIGLIHRLCHFTGKAKGKSKYI